MSKERCFFIRDLLPLYIDNLCSEESAAEIEAHLKECKKCRELYESMKADSVSDTSVTNELTSDDEALKRVIGKVNSKLTIHDRRLKWTCFGICAIVICSVVILLLPIKRIAPSDYEVNICSRTLSVVDRISHQYNDPVWNDNTIFFYPPEGSIDKYGYIVCSLAGYEKYTFAIADEYLTNGTLAGNGYEMSAVEITSDRYIKNCETSLLEEDGKNILHVEDIKTSPLEGGFGNCESTVTLFYNVPIHAVSKK